MDKFPIPIFVKTSDAPPGQYISAIYRHLQILVTERLQSFRIGSGQYIFFLTIANKEGVSQKALSEQLLIDKTTTAKAVRKLELEGYVHRESDPNDNRYNLLFLTKLGKETAPKVVEALGDITQFSRMGINEEDYAVLLSSLKKMLHNMNEQIRLKSKS